MKDKHKIKILSDMVYTLIKAQSCSHRAGTVEGICDAASYPFIPINHARNIESLYRLKEKLPDIKNWSGHRRHCPENQMFLDAGCGIGNVLLTASAVGLCGNWHGIEYFEKTYERAKAWLGLNEPDNPYYTSAVKIFKDDILTFKNYSKYDIIYFYCPFSDYRLQVRFEEYLEDEMKVGAILVPVMKQGWAIKKDKRFKRINIVNPVVAAWVKVKKGERQISEIPRFGRWSIFPEHRKLYEKKYAEILI